MGRATLSAPDSVVPAEFSAAVPVAVALVNVPFAHADRPSIQCGLLKAGLVRAGHAVDVFYLNLEVAAELGSRTYFDLASLRTDQFVGEWLFTVAAFGPLASDAAEYRQACPGIDDTCARLGKSFQELQHLRSEVMPAFVERWATTIDWSRYTAVGFTSTFEQNVAALALARRIKQEHPAVQVIFGGANFDGEMGPEYVRAFPWIDYAVVGEGDVALPMLVANLARDMSGVGLPGVTGRQRGEVITGSPGPKVQRMDELPDPDFDDYFSTLFRIGRERVLGTAPPRLLFESARGCWWGQKHHCTFCGLNNTGMAFRSKSPDRVIGELRRLSSRYQITNFEAVDNILDMAYVEKVCSPLVASHLDYTMFYEVKANLTRSQLRTLARAGIRRIQPGIESLSTHILALMRKGTTMLRNVRLLKWAHYYGMHVGWNVLTGFPGETLEDYAAQERLLPLLVFLPPPVACGPIWLERFSPYFFDSSFPVHDVRPRRAYDFLYPSGSVDRDAIAYFFDYEIDDIVPHGKTAPLHDLVLSWQQAWESSPRPVLVYQRAPDWIQVIDRRDVDNPRGYTFHDLEAMVYEACSETEHTPERVAAHLQETRGDNVPAKAVEEMLERFCALGLAIQEGRHFLSLALPANPNW